MRIMLITTTVIVGLVSATAANAQEPADEARAAFKKGVQHYNAGQVDAALEAFRRAYELKPSWRIQYNIGQCEAALKRYGLAVEAFEAYLAGAGDEIDADRRDQVLAELDRLRKMTGTLKVEGPDGVTIIVDGFERGTTPLPGLLRLVAGTDHDVVGKKGNTVVARRTVRVGGGETLTINLTEEDESTAEPPSSGEQLTTKDEQPTDDGTVLSVNPSNGEARALPALFWVGAGLTVATLGTGIGFGAASDARYDDFDADNKEVAAGTLPPDDSGLLSARDDVDSYSKVANAMFITSGVLAAATAVVLIVHYTSDDGDEEPAVARVSIAPDGLAVSF